MIHRFAAGLLGTHVGRRPEDDSALGLGGRRDGRWVQQIVPARPTRCVKRFGETKIEHLHGPVVANLDVGGFQIPMDDALAVRGVERPGDLMGDPQCFVQRQRAVHQAIGERGSLDELQHECPRPAGVLEPVDECDVRMIQRRQRAGFAFDARDAIGIDGKRIRQHLDGHVATEPGVGRAIHLAHAARSEPAADHIAAQPSAGAQHVVSAIRMKGPPGPSLATTGRGPGEAPD